MAKTKISEFSSTPANNTDIDSINIAEGCAPSNINDAIRELMAQLKDFQIGSQGDSFNGPIGTSTAAAGAFTTLSASSTVTLSGGTANGVLYLNGSKVATSGSALTFDGSLLSNTGRIKTATGSSGGSFDIGYASNVDSRSYRIQNDFNVYGDFVIAQSTTQTGTTYNALYSALNSGVQYWSVGGSEQMRLTSTGLGIGTSTVGARLTTRAAANSYTAGALQIESLSGTYKSYITNVGGLLLFSNSSTVDQLILDTSGNLGLGVTPSAWGFGGNLQFAGGRALSFNGSSTIYSNAYYNGTNTVYTSTGVAASFYQQNAGAHNWQIAPSGTAGNAISFTQAMTLDASGNLGVGTSSPNAKLDIVATTNTIRLGRSTSSYSTIDSNSSAGSLNFNADAGNIAGGGSMTFNFAGTEAMRIDSSRNLLVGATATIGTTAGLLVASSGANVQTITTNSTSSSAYYIGRFYSGGTEKGYIYYNGSTVAFTSTSDYRLKENIQPMTGALAKVAQLKPCTYTWKENGEAGQGFIAHELAEVVPDCVSGEKDAVDEEGTPRYQGIDTSFLVATLTAAIQELKAEFDAYKASHP